MIFFDTIFPGGFEQVDRPLDVDPLVKGRFSEAGAHARAGRKVDDLIELDAAEQFVKRRAVAQIAMDEFERFGQRLDVAEVPAFELRVVIRIEIIKGPDRVTVVQQAFANVRPDEAGPAGDQKVHAETLTIRAGSVERVKIGRASHLRGGPKQRMAALQKNQVMPTIPVTQFTP